MSTNIVVDSWAAIAFLRGEGQAANVVRRYIKRAVSGNLTLFMSVIDLGEVFYRLAQIAGDDVANESLRRLRRLPIEIIPVREAQALEAAHIKAHHRLAYADAFAVSTAKSLDGAVLTGDPEIVALPKNLVRVVRLPREERGQRRD